MPWQLAVAYFFGGALVANALPHLLSGASGRPLETPFASPPFRGLSSPTVNVAWSLFNVAVAYVLLVPVGKLEFRDWAQAAVCFAGFGAMALKSARSFGRLRRERLDEPTSPPTGDP
jgi:hypothetical protein